MDRHFVDTNLFLRFLTNDVPDQAHAVDQLLMRAEEGELELFTSSLTIAEIVWTLESYYELSSEVVRDHVVAILNTPGLFVEHQEQGLSSAITFDTKHFQRIPGILTHTPTDIDQES